MGWWCHIALIWCVMLCWILFLRGQNFGWKTMRGRLKLKTKAVYQVTFWILLLTFLVYKNSGYFIGQASQWTSFGAGVLQESILGPMLLLIYIDQIPDDLPLNAKLFTGDSFTILKSVYTMITLFILNSYYHL